MKIGIDLRALARGNRSGVEEYTIMLLTHVFERDRINTYILFFNAYKGSVPAWIVAWADTYPNVELRAFTIPNKLLNAVFFCFNRPFVTSLIGDVDIFFMPNSNFISLPRRTKMLLTIHDLSFEHIPETFSWKRRLWHLVVSPQRLAARAERILAVSEYTKQDVSATYNVSSDRISVVPNGLGEQYKRVTEPALLENVARRYNLPTYFFLFLGTIEPRKNIRALVRAYEEFRRTVPNAQKYSLVLAGVEGWKSARILNEISQSRFRSSIVRIGFVHDEDKPSLYTLADVFVYPSFFEGFGLPPLEALACQTPVITSNTSSLPSVVGRAALLIDPDRPSQIADALHELTRSSSLREQLQKHGEEAVQRYRWQASAKKFIDVLEQVR